MRQGDKYFEASIRTANEYWARIVSISAKLNLSDVYLSTDSQSLLDDIVKNYAPERPDLHFYWLPTKREVNGLTMKFVASKVFNKARVRPLIDIDLTDLFINQNSYAWLGTLSSNWCALFLLLR